MKNIRIYIIALGFLTLATNVMGQYIGLYAKKNGEFCFDKPIFTEEDTELNNKLRSADEVFNELKNSVSLSEEYWNGITFTETELLALKCNYVQDNADGKIEYAKSSGNSLPENFFAIGTKCNSKHCFVYDSKYKEYENWAKFSVVESAIVKMMKILHEKIKASHEISDYLLYDYENLNLLYGILKTVKEIYNADEIAIIIAP